jgi:hypothetical protein
VKVSVAFIRRHRHYDVEHVNNVFALLIRRIT